MFVEASQTKLLQGAPIPDFTPEQSVKIDTFLVKNYGFKMAQQLKNDCSKRKDLMRAIVVKELNKTYKYPEAAFAALDFKGKGYIETQDFLESKIMYKLPFSKEDVKGFLETDTIFKKVPKLKIQMFAKFFYPSTITESKTNFDFSDSDQEEQVGTKKDLDLNTIDNSSLMSTTRNREITVQIKQIENIIKERLSNNWVSVRKAFLDLDEDYDGFLTPEDFAKVIGGSSGSSRFDFNLIKMLLKMRNRGKNSKINYTEFSQWFGQVIEPAEAFYFRHDSQKNPQYEKNMQKTVIQYSGPQKKIRELISNVNLKDKFIEKIRLQFKTTKRAFRELSKAQEQFIYYEQLQQLVKNWGFETSEEQIKELFDWLDYDKDNKISYEDLRSTAGKEISPMEQLFFRQDVKPARSVNCKYEKCWENNNSNSKSAYCTLHQKVLRNLCLDRFAQLVSYIDETKWDQLSEEIIAKGYQMTLKEFSQLLQQTINKQLKYQEKEYIWETFKVKQHLEDNPDSIDDRLVSLQAFLNARKQTRMRKINELISMEEEEEQAAEDIKLKGLTQVDEQFVLKIAITKKAQWGGIWKSIKTIDKDNNGYVTAEELEEIFREWFPVELDGKSLIRYFRKFCSIQNRVLIHYKKIKDDINSKIMIYDKQDMQISQSLKEIKQVRDTTPQPTIKRPEEEDLNIQGQTPAGMTPIASGRASLYGDLKDDRIIIKKKLGKLVNRSITPNMRKHSVAETTKLPQQNLMVRNTSIQKLNNITTIDDYQHEDKNTTPVMKGNNQLNELTRNMSGLKSTALLSEFSKSGTKTKFSEDLKNKLAYEWKNIYRGLSQLDQQRKGTININTFNKVVHQFKVYLSREELRKIEIGYGGQHSTLGIEIDYIKLSQELGLHKSSLDYIRTKSQKFIDQMTRVKDLDTKSTLTHRLNTIQAFDGGDLINTKTQASKIKALKDFLGNMDKNKTGQVPGSTFNKMTKIFGVNINSSKNELGMVDYQKSLQELM